jgi:type I restriction enzyme S subunit
MDVSPGIKQADMGSIADDWIIRELGSFSEVTSGGTPSRGVQEYWNGKIPWVTTSELGFRTITSASQYISQLGLNNSAAKLLKPGTLLLALYGQGKTRGKVSMLGIEAATNQACASIVVEPDISREYVFQLLVSKYDIIRSMSNSGSQDNLTGHLVKSIVVPLPPTKIEQDAIAAALTDADSLIESLERLVAKKTDIKKGAMQELLTGRKRLPGFDAEWSTRLLSAICWFQEGPGVRNFQFTSSGVKLLNGTNIVKGVLDLSSTNRFISENEARGPYAHFLADSGDLVIASSGISIDRFHEKVAVVRDFDLPFCMNTSTIRFKPFKVELASDFLFHFLTSDSFKKQIGGQATGSAQLNFGPSHVAKVSVHLPVLSEQFAIATILSDMDEEIAGNENKLSKARQLKQGMMQELLTGRIRLV